MKVKIFLLCVCCLASVAAQQISGKTKSRTNVAEGQGRTLGVVRPVLGLASGLLGGGGAGLLGDYRPIASGSASQSDMNGNNGYYGGSYYGGYPAYGGYRPARYPGLLNLLSGFGGYPIYAGYGGYPAYAGYGSYGGYPTYAGYGSYGGYGSSNAYGQRPVQRPITPSYSTTNNLGSASLTNPPTSSGSPQSGLGANISPGQAAQLGQALGTLLRPLLSNGGGSGSVASPEAASSLLSILG